MKRLKLQKLPFDRERADVSLRWNGPRSGHRQASQSDSSADLWGVLEKSNTQLHRLATRGAGFASVHPMEKDMATFVLTLDWTDQGIRNLREAPKRSEAAKALAKKVGVEIKEVYLTTGAHDILLLAEAPLGDHITKFALTRAASLGSGGSQKEHAEFFLALGD